MVVNDYGKTAETVTLTKPNNPLDGLNKKKERPPTTYNAGNPDSGLGQAHTCCGAKPANGIPTISNDNTFINNRLEICTDLLLPLKILR